MYQVEDALLETRFPDLTERQRKCVEMLANGVNQTVAAKHLGVSRMTLYKWLKKPNVSAALEELKSDEFRLTEGPQSIHTEISNILLRIARNENAEDRDRIRACQVLLNQAADWYQRRFVARRMDKLEARILDSLGPTANAINATTTSEEVGERRSIVEDAFDDLESLADASNHFLEASPEGGD